MNYQDKSFFSALYKDRLDSAEILEKPSMRGIKNSVVEKYSDQAHFIYELLQNADDAHAKNAKFILESDRLLFSHDGTRLFSVTNPETEEIDSKTGTLGDINAITSIANSNKTASSIGKFGVGFKAVFQYTHTPHIYDPNFRFKIERFIVPVLLDNDAPERNQNETLFIFPFDNPDRNAETAFKDILDKLKNLSYPLLFLTNLQNIEFQCSDYLGLYGKKIDKTYSFGEITAEKVHLTMSRGEELYDEILWLFSRQDECNRKYSLGFFLEEDGHLRPVKKTAFCFFPTKETTQLNFIIHAPFLLTDSREGIRAGEPHNEHMISLLSKLAADSIVCLKQIGERESIRLIDDRIIDIIPYDPGAFSDPSDKSKISFYPFFEKIKRAFEQNEIIPARDGFVSKSNAYWAAVPNLPILFSDKQLGLICENDNAKWVFCSIGRDNILQNNKPLSQYVDSLVKTNLNEDAIIIGRSRDYTFNRFLMTRQYVELVKGITADFIEKQDISWLHDYYKWISETKHRTEISQSSPIFLDQNGHAVAAYDKDKHLILFLPVEGVTGYRVVHPDLLANPDTRKFIESFGIKEPSLRDQIYNKILPLYRQNSKSIDTDAHFKIFFEYYCQCPSREVNEFIRLIQDYGFLLYYSAESKVPLHGSAQTMYFPTEFLKTFFESKPATRFVAIDKYESFTNEKNRDQLKPFLYKLGVKEDIEIINYHIDRDIAIERRLPFPNSTRSITWKEKRIDGCSEIINSIVTSKDISKSICLWNCLLKIIETVCYDQHKNLETLLRGTCDYFYYSPRAESFQSSDVKLLRESNWILNRSGNFVSPSELSSDQLSEQYNTYSETTKDLIVFLGMKEPAQNVIDAEAYLTDSQKEKIHFAEKLAEIGLSITDLDDIRELKRLIEERRHRQTAHEDAATDSGSGSGTKLANPVPLGPQENTSPAENVIQDIVRRTGVTGPKPFEPITFPDIENEIDRDDMLPAVVDYSEKIEKAKQKSASEIDKIAYCEELQNKALKAKRYSFAWFLALLELEYINSMESNSNSKEISISFAKVEREPGTQRTLILKHPNRYIPQFIEDLADIPLVLHMGTTKKTIPIEVANIRSYTLRVKIKKGSDIEGINFSDVNLATIDAQSPVFLLEALKQGFDNLNLDEDFDMQENLPENIEFIFGPPGTGKTTYLARNVLLPLMQEKSQCKVLVLAPTNKAADVLVHRLMEICGNNHGYEDWLVRFGVTGDEDIEQSPVYKDKTFDIRSLRKNVTVTTIARFPYDYFMSQSDRIFLNGINWDYIVIDEASMIPIANIIYPLYKKTPTKFIIAGDPFQIEPIASVELWKDENIYTVVRLNSFTNPQTFPHPYKVNLLTTQYRSIPEIGRIFSEFAYGGILQHFRRSSEQKQITFSNDLGIKTLNIIKYPVSKYESIYRAKRLQHSSSYQIYSALFVYEYIRHLSMDISQNNPNSLITIGVIAPYRAQADLIDKLLGSEELPKHVEVQVGTIHGFQGDECDIIFSVFNTPPFISSAKEMFLNKKNIINVSISRARDYLFIIMPDNNTENIENLTLVRRVEKLVKQSDSWVEKDTQELETVLFNNPHFLEENAFSTSHQSVNVYGLPERYYEIRAEDNAVDVQIHKTAKKGPVYYGIQSTDSEHRAVGDIKRKTVLAESENKDEKINDSLIIHDQKNLKTDPINNMPEEVRKKALPVHITGYPEREYHIFAYNGKLKSYFSGETTRMFIIFNHSGKELKIPVSVDEMHYMIYISKDAFTKYRKILSGSEPLNLLTYE